MSRKDVSDTLVCFAHYVRDQYKARELSTPELLREIAPLEKNYTEDWLMYWTGEHFNVVFRALERTCDHGLIEYGTWVRGAWLEPEGRTLLKQELDIDIPKDRYEV